MKKIVTVAAILSVIGFASYQTASAHSSFHNNGYGYCNPYTSDEAALTKEDAEVIEKFQTETSAISKQIVIKRSELNALLSNDNPDEKKVAKLTGDLYDLKTELYTKAENNGIKGRYAYDLGPGMMHDYGWNYGRHMMGW